MLVIYNQQGADMGMTNAEKQVRHRERLKAKGLVHVQGWVTPEQAEVIRAIMAGKPVTYNHAPEPEPPPPTQPEPEASPKVRFVPVEPGRPERLKQYEIHQDGEARPIGYVWQTIIAGRKQWQGFPSGFNSRTYTGPSRRQVVERIHRYRQL